MDEEGDSSPESREQTTRATVTLLANQKIYCKFVQQEWPKNLTKQGNK